MTVHKHVICNVCGLPASALSDFRVEEDIVVPLEGGGHVTARVGVGISVPFIEDMDFCDACRAKILHKAATRIVANTTPVGTRVDVRA